MLRIPIFILHLVKKCCCEKGSWNFRVLYTECEDNNKWFSKYKVSPTDFKHSVYHLWISHKFRFLDLLLFWEGWVSDVTMNHIKKRCSLIILCPRGVRNFDAGLFWECISVRGVDHACFSVSTKGTAVFFSVESDFNTWRSTYTLIGPVLKSRPYSVNLKFIFECLSDMVINTL